MISCLVFSRDRAMQLDALLRSINRFCPTRYDRIDVLCKTMEGPHKLSYDIVESEHPHVQLWEEWADLREHVTDWLGDASEYVAFHADDDVFYLPHAALTLPDGDVICWSPRLGLNTTYCHPLGREQAKRAGLFSWAAGGEWPGEAPDFEYPFSIDGHVYRRDLVEWLILRCGDFDNPTSFEAAMHGTAHELLREHRPMMWCELHSSLVSIPANVVSDTSGNPRGSTPGEQPNELCMMYLDGERIDLGAMDFSNVIGAHQDIPLRFHRPRGDQACRAGLNPRRAPSLGAQRPAPYGT